MRRLLAITSMMVLLSVATAYAAQQEAAVAQTESRRLDLTKPTLNEDGQALKDLSYKEPLPKSQDDPDPACRKCPDLTMWRVVSHALSFDFQDDHPTAEEKFSRGMLAMSIRRTPDNVELSAEEIALVKRLVAKSYSPLVVSQVFPVLDPNSKPGPAK